ncbi:unnamed protein product [Dovyalis caffra]|uniref:Phytocyanin domain-containing protein n=1 Tax=Dovyalis caffra TaxID=77055 RepID=A0AAV1S552_9ROSI|nr:unnamed protein product [Dovyalis caffra]
MRSLIVFVVLGAASLLLLSSEAVDYQVGDSTGWQNPSSSSFYSDWASGKTFSVGDTLTFTFATDSHDVATVSKSDYDNCNIANQNNVIKDGPANITLRAAGDYHYFCTFSNHCSVGQKLAITVAASNSTPSTPSPPGTPAGTPSSSPPPPPPSAASTHENDNPPSKKDSAENIVRFLKQSLID